MIFKREDQINYPKISVALLSIGAIGYLAYQHFQEERRQECENLILEQSMPVDFCSERCPLDRLLHYKSVEVEGKNSDLEKRIKADCSPETLSLSKFQNEIGHDPVSGFKFRF